MSTLPIITCLLGMGIVLMVIPLILRICRHFNLAGRTPDLHHTHRAPIQRLGGIALAAAFVGVGTFVAIFFPEQGEGRHFPVVPMGALAMFVLGLWDDIWSVSARKKLLGQVIIATAVSCCGISIQVFKIPFTETVIHLGAWGGVITVIWLVTMTNLINLIDGVDGLAGGISLMLMALLAYVGHQSGNLELIASGMAGALLGFLWFNFPPARIYMGDGGAYFLGFQIGIYTIVSSQKGTVLPGLAAPPFLLALPIVDTTLAILRRGLRGLPVFRPDRKHIHHRLLDMGFSRRRAVLSLYAVTLVFLAMGFTAFVSRGHLIPALLGISALVLMLCAGRFSFSRRWFAVSRVVGDSLKIRREVKYAVCLTRWLALEGARCQSIEGLWSDLVFLAQRLGFTSIKLTLADGERSWVKPDSGDTVHFSRQELQGGLLGTLEVKAHSRLVAGSDETVSAPSTVAGPARATESSANASAASAGAVVSGSRITDGKLFEIVSELLAEGWIQAVGKWNRPANSPLRFDSKVPVQRTIPRPRTHVAVPVLQGMPQVSP